MSPSPPAPPYLGRAQCDKCGHRQSIPPGPKVYRVVVGTSVEAWCCPCLQADGRPLPEWARRDFDDGEETVP